MLIRGATLGGEGRAAGHDLGLTGPWEWDWLGFRSVTRLGKRPKKPGNENPFTRKEAEQDVTVLREFRGDK